MFPVHDVVTKYKTLINPTIKNCSCGALRLEGV
jgi:hypothetical protein